MATIKLTNYADYVDNSQNDQYGAANHTWYLLKGEDVLYGGTGRDTVYGFDGADYVNGGAGNDTIYGESGWDTLYGSEGSDTIYGGAGNDTLTGSSDSTYDVLFGNDGNDWFSVDGDKVNGGIGNDTVNVSLYYGNERADITLGAGRDTLYLEFYENDYADYNQNRIDIRDFKAEDKLTFSTNSLAYVQALDRLDVNNDRWLSAKDVEQYDYDGVTVHVGSNYLELEVQDTSVFLHGMTKASFDFLA